MTNLVELIFFSLLSGFWTALAIALNEWLFKRRIERVLDKLENTVKKKLKTDRSSI